jgi:hypothetical protein
MTLLVGKSHLAYSFDAVADGFALRHVDGAEDTHFQIYSRISHDGLSLMFCWLRRRFCLGGTFCQRAGMWAAPGAMTHSPLVLPRRRKMRPSKICCGNSVENQQSDRATGWDLTQKRLPEKQLKLCYWTERVGKDRLQMFDGLAQWIRLGTNGRFLLTT